MSQSETNNVAKVNETLIDKTVPKKSSQVAKNGKAKRKFGGRVKRAEGEKKSLSKTQRAGLQFPVGRLGRYLRNGKYAERVSGGAPVYLAAVLEYLTAEILELAGNVARDNNKSRLVPRHVQLAVRHDKELNTLLSEVIIAQGGVIANIEQRLRAPRKNAKTIKNKKEVENESNAE